MKISVIIPTYKPKKYIDECLASLGRQTLDNRLFEIIIVLNGCREPWYTQINEQCHKLLPNKIVHIIQTDKGGVSNARNIALDMAKGEYIAFIDDDDYVSSYYLEGLLREASDNIMVLSDSLSFEDGSSDLNETYSMHETYLCNCKRIESSSHQDSASSQWTLHEIDSTHFNQGYKV